MFTAKNTCSLRHPSIIVLTSDQMYKTFKSEQQLKAGFKKLGCFSKRKTQIPKKETQARHITDTDILIEVILQSSKK